jgi:hypothetical protein
MNHKTGEMLVAQRTQLPGRFVNPNDITSTSAASSGSSD